MSEAGRKLTIRMPDNRRLRSVTVGRLHVDPGGRVQDGGPVMSLTKRRKDHIVRSPRPGRVVPLVAVGDVINPGDPLYILHIDEAALAAANQQARALVPIEQKKWSSGIKADEIIAVPRDAKSAPTSERLRGFAESWGKPILAIALYVLACFALLPILNAFSVRASTPVLAAMIAGCVAFGAMIYYLYAPSAGAGPRWTVRLVAASWIGISTLAIFSTPDDAEELTLADATERIGEIFASDPVVPKTQPDTVPTPAPVLASGVAVDRWRPAEVVPDYTQPRSVLAELGDSVTPHGVTVRVWARVNPGTTSGDEIGFDLADLAPAVAGGRAVTEHAEALPDVTVAELDETTRTVPAAIPRRALAEVATPDAGAVVLAEPALPVAPRVAALSDGGAERELQPPLVVEAAAGERVTGDVPDALPLDPVAQVVALVLAEETSGPVAADRLWSGRTISLVPDFSAVAAALAGSGEVIRAEAARPDIAPGAWTGAAGIPVILTAAPASPAEPGRSWTGSIASATAARATTPVAPRPQDGAVRLATVPDTAPGAWLTSGGVPVPATDSAVMPEIADDPTEIAAVSAGPDHGATPATLSLGGSPDLILVSALRSGDDLWMEAQAALLSKLPVRQTTISSVRAVEVQRNTRPLDPEAAADDATGLSPPDVPTLLAFATPRGQPAPREVLSDLPSLHAAAILAPAMSKAVDLLPRAVTTPALPAVPSAQPDYDERLLLFAYYDDPRFDTHPREGDTWAAMLSPELAEAVRSSTVESVRELYQVNSWCGAANDPDREKRRTMNRDDYRTAWLGDRMRLLQVRVALDFDKVAQLEQELPIFAGRAPGMFHNRLPLIGGRPGDPLMMLGERWLVESSNIFMDPNTPPDMIGGHYYSKPESLLRALREAGCTKIDWNSGTGPSKALGRRFDERFRS